MRDDLNAERIAQRNDLSDLGDAADLGDAGLCDIDRAVFDHGTEFKQAAGILPGRDRDDAVVRAPRRGCDDLPAARWVLQAR